jgi:mercuric ion transport protein
MDKNSKLMSTGFVAVLLSLLCCVTPVLAIALGALGLAAYASKADYILVAVFLAGMALIGIALVRRRRQREPKASQ